MQKITLIGLPWAKNFAGRFACYLDDFVGFPGFPGMPGHASDVYALPEFLAHPQRQRYDLAIQMHGPGEIVNSLVAALGSRISAGFHTGRSSILS
ncbi:MAG: hypothetical protein ACRD8U_09190 [Pyrinomonadaceae bacterium]